MVNKIKIMMVDICKRMKKKCMNMKQDIKKNMKKLIEEE